MKTDGLMSCFIWWRYGGSDYEAPVRSNTETVDLTGEHCAQLPDVVHLDVDSGKQVMNSEHTTLPYNAEFNNPIISDCFPVSHTQIMMTLWRTCMGWWRSVSKHLLCHTLTIKVLFNSSNSLRDTQYCWICMWKVNGEKHAKPPVIVFINSGVLTEILLSD